jgi:hypothetical protein
MGVHKLRSRRVDVAGSEVVMMGVLSFHVEVGYNSFMVAWITYKQWFGGVWSC